jgi:hypothetical protein
MLTGVQLQNLNLPVFTGKQSPAEAHLEVPRRRPMSATQLSNKPRPLCYEHHVEMGPNRGALNGDGHATKAQAYACTASDCHIHYDVSRGYFMLSQNGSGNEWDVMPKVKCFFDAAPMYLAEIDLKKRAFRLWRCPQCGASQTNEEGLVGLTPLKTQESGAQP